MEKIGDLFGSFEFDGGYNKDNLNKTEEFYCFPIVVF